MTCINDKIVVLINTSNALQLDFLKNNEYGVNSPEVQSLVGKLQDYITQNFYTCGDEILAGLGKMYIADERFKENIDQNGIGTTDFASKAIEIYCK